MHTRIRNSTRAIPIRNAARQRSVPGGRGAWRTVFVRGQVGQDSIPDQHRHCDGRGQAEQAMHNVRQLLGEAGAGSSTSARSRSI